jgi:hypothetical protein
MLDTPASRKARLAPPSAATALDLRPLSAFPEARGADPSERIAEWMRSYLMRPHPDLGRTGAVCPYTSISAKTDLALVGASSAHDEDEIYATMREAIATFEAMDCAPGLKAFRCVLVGFPYCESEAGRATLKRVQNRLRPESTRRAKMIGLFEPHAADRGLINPEFRPLRSPLPLLAIRSLVEADAPFVVRNPRLAPIYLWTFPRTAPARLWQCWRR